MTTRRGRLLSLLILIVLLLSAVPSCALFPPGDAAEVLEQVYMLNELDFELDSLVGEKVWCLGVYGDTRFSDMGVGFLVLDYDMLVVDEEMDPHSFAVLDGGLPPAVNNGDEMLVYGEVQDFQEVYDAFVVDPAPLITVEDFVVLHTDAETDSWQDTFLEMVAAGITGLLAPGAGVSAQDAPEATRPSNCDRALIISGGVDDANNRPRYKENVRLKYERLRELGFDEDQIDVLYNDGGDIDADPEDIDTTGATKDNFDDIIDEYLADMHASCTLTIFVTDHGTGYNPDQGYHGQRPAFAGSSEYENGETYAEDDFKVDLRKKVYKTANWTNSDGDTWQIRINKSTDTLELYKREGGEWVYKGKDIDGDGRITEDDTGQDIDGDGNINDLGWDTEALGDWQHANNTYDTDRDGDDDVRVRWDGTKYVFERFQGGEWKQMGADTNGDFVIDDDDGGVDWNLDGDKNDRVGFHEGINLWGRGEGSVLWDDEFAKALKELSDNGIHIVVEMVQCFGGGFVSNCEGIVEKIVTGSSEETKHFNRLGDDNKYHAIDQETFIKNLNGIDVESWDWAWDKAVKADEDAWDDAGSKPKNRNQYTKWEKPVIETESGVGYEDGMYDLVLRIPDDLEGEVYDIEIIFGLQKLRWTDAEVMELPEGLEVQDIPGGIRIVSDEPFSVEPMLIRLRGQGGDETLKIQLTDEDHEPLGYVIPRIIEPIPPVVELLDANVDIDANVDWHGSICEGYLQFNLEADDLTDGDIPVARVVLIVDDKVVHDSGPIRTIRYREQVYVDVFCSERLDVELIATNAFGQTVTRSGEVRVPVPPMLPPPGVTILLVSVDAESESHVVDSSCESTLTIFYEAEDVSGGDYPVRQVVLRVNGSVWEHSGLINTDYYSHTEVREVDCGEEFHIQVSAVNSIGRTATATRSITTQFPI